MSQQTNDLRALGILKKAQWNALVTLNYGKAIVELKVVEAAAIVQPAVEAPDLERSPDLHCDRLIMGDGNVIEPLRATEKS